MCTWKTLFQVDLRHIYGVTLDSIAYLPIAVSLGYLIGSLCMYFNCSKLFYNFCLFNFLKIVGWLYKYLNRQLMLIIFVFLLCKFLEVSLGRDRKWPAFMSVNDLYCQKCTILYLTRSIATCTQLPTSFSIVRVRTV